MSDIVSASLPYVYNITLVILTFDAAHWACTLARHALWLSKHPQREDIDCDRLTYRMLFTAATLSGCHLLLVNLTWVYVTVFYGYHLKMFLLISGVDVMGIHLYALIARCTNLDHAYWPYFSVAIANYVVSPCRRFVIKIKPPTYPSVERRHKKQ